MPPPTDTRTFAYGRAAFAAVADLAAPSHPLVAVYATLIRIELALKDYDPSLRWHNHDLPLMLQHFGVDVSLKEQFENTLKALWAVGKDGTAKAVPAKSYPYLRYLRHVNDHGNADSSDDAELLALLNLLQQSIEPALRANGVTP